MLKIKVSTSKKEEMIDITDKISELISESKIKEGICYLFCPHTTCALTINENADSSVKRDILAKLKDTISEDFPYQHLEGNSPAHIKTVLTGSSLIVFVEDSTLMLGRWQGIFLCEFDGPRTREVWVKIKN